MLHLLIYKKKDKAAFKWEKKMKLISKDNLRSFNSIFVQKFLKYGYYLPLTALNQFEIKLPKRPAFSGSQWGFFG